MADSSTLLTEEDLARTTTRKLVGTLESVALLMQTGDLVKTSFVDKVSDNGRLLLWSVALLHGIAAVVAHKKSGPFARGGPWLVLWLGAAVAMPLIMAHLVGAAEYGASPACVQLCGYPVMPLVIFAFYPWWSLQRAHLRLWIELGMLAVIVLEPLFLVLYLHTQPGLANYLSVIFTALVNILAYVIGKAVGRMCAVAAEAQVQLQNESFYTFFEMLHVEFKSRVKIMRNSVNNPVEIVKHLDQLEDLITKGRVKMLLVPVRVPLAELFSERMRIFDKQLALNAPSVGALTVRREVAILLDKALGDLLTNAVEYRATAVQVNFWVDSGIAQLEIFDNGPGFPSSVLDDESKSLYRLRRSAQQLGGNLTQSPGPDGGVRLHLSAPLHPSRTRWEVTS